MYSNITPSRPLSYLSKITHSYGSYIAFRTLDSIHFISTANHEAYYPNMTAIMHTHATQTLTRNAQKRDLGTYFTHTTTPENE